jgi:ferredoxin-NADP reductase
MRSLLDRADATGYRSAGIMVFAQEARPLIEVVVSSVRFAAQNTNFYELRRGDGRALPPAEAGGHVDLRLPNGTVRQYSLLTPDPAPASYTLGIKLDPASRGGSKFIFEHVKAGDVLSISEPRNNFRLVENADHVVLIAGGIGITPIWAMMQRLKGLGRSFELHYASRSRAEMVFLDQVSEIPAGRLHFDDEAQGAWLDLKRIVTSAPLNSHLYCCGPLPMLAAFETATAGIPGERIHVEYFTPREPVSHKGGFTVRLARANQEFVIPPGKSILEVLLDAGFDLPYSCQEGICGTCETAVVAGIPDHHDSVLTQAERAANKTMMICCGGAKSDILVLDL